MKMISTTSQQDIIDRLHPTFRESVAHVLQAQQKLLNELQQDRLNVPTGVVHHYTTQDGLEKITQHGTLWLSDYTKLVDTSEVAYGFGIAMETLRQQYEDGPKTGRLRRFKWLVESMAMKGLGTYFSGYVLSLSKHEDDLPQWREYGDRERGYCLSFDGLTLDKAFESFSEAKGLYSGGSFDVLYDEQRLRALLRKYVDNAYEAVLWLEERPGVLKEAATAIYEIGANLMVAFIFTALFFKNPKYVSEAEYRYFMGTFPTRRVSGVQMRGTGKKKTGYFAMDWKSAHASALTQVWIGPGTSEKKGRRVVAGALTKAGLSTSNIDVRMSTVPPTRR